MKRATTLMLMLGVIGLSGCGGNNATIAEAVGSNWDLRRAGSDISYVTIKQNDIAENNRFSIFTGFVSPSGDVEIDIALNSVQTQIDTRDMRMKKIVFKTQEYPMANIRAKIPMAELNVMELGERRSLESEVAVSLAGVSESFDGIFQVTRIGVNTVLVESKEPIMVQTSDFGFVESVAELQRLAKLESITPVVPVSFSLMFER